eukprot:symbB.v1.2.007130.t3/scaffold435.1/size205859/5
MVDSSHRWLPLLALLLCLKLPTFFPFCGPSHRNFPRTVRLVAQRSFPENYWKVLGVEPGSSVKEVKKVYRQRAKKEHPDVNKSPDALKRWRLLSDAYGKLIDPVYRKEWEASQQAQEAQKASQRVRYSDSTYRSDGGRRESSSRSTGFQGEAQKWATSGWDYFRDLMQKTEKFQSRSSNGNANTYALRESKAAEEELYKVQEKLKKLREDEAKYLELTEQFKRSGQKKEELEAGRRTLELRNEVARTRQRARVAAEQDALSILFYADLLALGDIQLFLDSPTGSLFPEPPEEKEPPFSPTPDTEERSSLKTNTLGEFTIEKAEAKETSGDPRTPTPPDASTEGSKVQPYKEIASTVSALACNVLFFQ